MTRTFVVGVGTTKPQKIGTRDWTYPEMVAEAVHGALSVPGARIGLQHNLGLGGACVVTLYSAGQEG